MAHQQRGFTLIELVVVIVILGILAATALPKFVNLGQDARIAAVNQFAASYESATRLVKAKAEATNTYGCVAVVSINGKNFSVCNGYPVISNLGGGLGSLVDLIEFNTGNFEQVSQLGPHSNNNSYLFKVKGAPNPDQCAVQVEQNNNNFPWVDKLTSGC